jgi:hypothetical protein
LKEQILREERKKFDSVSGIGARAYYYEDRVEFLAGDRSVAVWVNRNSRTESESEVKSAMMTLAKRIAGRMSQK